LKLPAIVVRDRVRGLQKLPWKSIGPTFASVRFEHRDLGTVTLIARLPDRPGTCCTFKGPAVFDRPAATIEASAAAVYAAFRAAAGDVETTGGAVVATVPAEALKTAADVARVCEKDGRYTGLRIENGRLCGSDGKSLFVAEAPVSAVKPLTLPLDGLRTFAGGEIQAKDGKLGAGPWVGTEPNDGRYPDFGALTAAAVTRADWTAEVDGAELLGALKTADAEGVLLSIDAGRFVVAGEESRSALTVRGAGDVTTTAKMDARRLLEALRFVGAKGPVRLRTCKEARFLRIEGDAPDRCAVVAEIVPAKVKA